MWPPTTVVQEHKRRANFIWASLVMLIISYSLWLIISTYNKRKNPTVSISIKDDRYSFPTITICAFAGTAVGYGCDSPYYSCVQDMYSYIHSPNGFENINGDIYTSDVAVLNDEYSSACVDLDQSDMAEIDNQSGLFPLRLVFVAIWPLNSGTDSDDTDDDETQIENSEGAYVFFTDPEISDPLGNHNTSTFVGVIPFTRQLANDTPDSFTQTAITMKLTESINLDGTNVKTYSAGTISSKDYLIPTWGVESSTQDKAVMLLEILQPGLTHTVRREVDPLEWAELLGSIGGTWEILLILWGIFFIARHSDEPELKGRDLVKTVQKGAQNVARGAASIVSGVSNKRGLKDSSTSETKETVPNWDILQAATSNHPTDHQARRPPPAYDFGGNQATNSSGGGHVQASRDTEYRRHSVEGIKYAPSHNIPAIDDLPRPMHRPF